MYKRIENQAYPEVEAIGTPNKLGVLLHGLGSDGYDLINLVPMFQYAMPDYHFISPHALEPYEGAAVGYQWFSVGDRTPAKILQVTEVAAKALVKIIEAKQAQLNISNEHTVIIGFSQGAMLGLYMTLTQQERFAAMIAFSGRLIPPMKCLNIATPVCLIHGVDDQIVEVNEMDQTIKYLKQNQIQYNALKIPNLDHSIDARGIEYAIDFLKQRI